MRGTRASLWGVLLLGLVLTGETAWSQALEPPGLERHADDRLTLAPRPDVLQRELVQAQLGSGLTTVFEYRLDTPSGRDAAAVVRVEVRWDLWDEVYLVRWYGSGTPAGAAEVPGQEALARWWDQLRVPLSPVRAAAGVGGGRVTLTLTVAPFSAAEQRDAQRWFSSSLREGGGAGGEVARVAEDGQSGLQVVFDALLATSIDSRALLRYRWRVRLPQ